MRSVEQIRTIEFWQMISAVTIAFIIYMTAESPFDFWSHSLTLGSLVILRWFRFTHEFTLQFVEDKDDLFHHLWLLDAFLLTVASVETGTINLLIFAAIGVSFSPLIKELGEEVQHKRRTLSRALATTLALFALSIFWGKATLELNPVREGCILLAGLATLWIYIQMIEDKHTDQTTKSSLLVTERLFFHDLINHTHGIMLSIEAKKNPTVELMQIKDEIQKLQLLVSDHYKYHHKDLKGLKLFFKVSELEIEAKKVFENYMPSPDWKLHWHSDIVFDGQISAAQFIRIVTNIAKNMAESKSMEAEVYFHAGIDKLQIKTKNRISKEYHSGPSEIWKHHALTDQMRDLGSGLKSVHKQCLALKGQFHFSVEGEFWINKVTLPIAARDYLKLDKKAA